jgi:hypothetical protein
MIAFVPRLFRRLRAKQPNRVTASELEQRLADGRPLVIVYVRQGEEFTAPPGHLPGAVFGGDRPTIETTWFIEKPGQEMPSSGLGGSVGGSPDFVAAPLQQSARP